MSSIIFYGAGQNAHEKFEQWVAKGLCPVCFADMDRAKHHTMFETPHGGVEILPLLEAISRYPDYKLYLTQFPATRHNVRNFLLGIGIPSERIKVCDGTEYGSDIFEESSVYKMLSLQLFQIYSALQDDLSRALFLGRLEYTSTHKLTGLFKAMTQDAYIKWIKSKQIYAEQKLGLGNLWDLLKDNYPVQKDEIYLLGIENNLTEYNWVVKRFLDAMPGLGIKLNGCILPYSISGKNEFMGIRCLSESELLNRITDNTRLIIGAPSWVSLTKDIAERYSDYKNILIPIADSAQPQYFDFEIFSPDEDEVFVDVGVYNLESSMDFIKYATKGFRKIYAFEPDPVQYRISLARLNKIDEILSNKIQLINKGLSSKTSVLEFSAKYSPSGASADSEQKIEIDVVSLDTFLDGEAVTFIKMDVEGMEMDVLRGMEHTIRKCNPKLAVCIYHKHEDLFEIASYILGLVPKYKFYIRHYNSNETETVLFCKL